MLKALNDSTRCFIPVKGDTAKFLFIYSDSLGLDATSVVTFNIKDYRDDLVYQKQILIPSVHGNHNQFGIPDIQYGNCIPISWDGRRNVFTLPGHFADPDNDPYRAYIEVNPGEHCMMSNVDTFDVIPMIDSVIVTHMPTFPPINILSTYRDSVFSVIKGKINDSNDSEDDYRYYAPAAIPPNQNPQQIRIWNALPADSNYFFWDTQTPTHKRYYEDNYSKIIRLQDWLPDKFGQLSYKWKVIYDQRVEGSRFNVRYDIVSDTTAQWGNNWLAEISPLSRITTWWRDGYPYMRLLVYSEVKNEKNTYILQGDTSATGKNAHKIIFGGVAQYPYMDIVDWAITHIGVPYAIKDYTVKIPYLKIDCSSLVFRP
jgi:hypothetical protein